MLWKICIGLQGTKAILTACSGNQNGLIDITFLDFKVDHAMQLQSGAQRIPLPGHTISSISSSFATAGRCPIFVEVLLAPIAKPHAKDLGDFLLFNLREGVIELKRTRALCAACGIPVCVPIAACKPYATTYLFEQGIAA
jgi:hypothetical protein